MPAYFVARFEPKNPAALAEYSQSAAPIIKKFGGILLFKGGSESLICGSDTLTRIAVFEFPDRATLNSFYSSSEYEALVAKRNEGADMVLSAFG